jgi:hypothetical protein
LRREADGLLGKRRSWEALLTTLVSRREASAAGGEGPRWSRMRRIASLCVTNDGHLAATAGAPERVHLVDLCNQPRPVGRAAPAGLAGLFGRLTLAQAPGSARAVGIVAVEERPVLTRVRGCDRPGGPTIPGGREPRSFFRGTDSSSSGRAGPACRPVRAAAHGTGSSAASRPPGRRARNEPSGEKAPVAREQVQVGLPLQQVPGGGHRQ